MFSQVTSLVDSVTFICENWTDPENIGIKSYLLYSTDLSKDPKVDSPLKKVTQFDPSSPSTFLLGPGNYSFFAEIMDTWGAKVLSNEIKSIDI